ncbi:MAG TPA: hypothetical protein VFN10_09625, partial [Thermoanaerobaculia bacterium]|nr:hypothetical protein [Thermoanaerobaculia bacterium]
MEGKLTTVFLGACSHVRGQEGLPHVRVILTDWSGGLSIGPIEIEPHYAFLYVPKDSIIARPDDSFWPVPKHRAPVPPEEPETRDCEAFQLAGLTVSVPGAASLPYEPQPGLTYIPTLASMKEEVLPPLSHLTMKSGDGAAAYFDIEGGVLTAIAADSGSPSGQLTVTLPIQPDLPFVPLQLRRWDNDQ